MFKFLALSLKKRWYPKAWMKEKSVDRFLKLLTYINGMGIIHQLFYFWRFSADVAKYCPHCIKPAFIASHRLVQVRPHHFDNLECNLGPTDMSSPDTVPHYKVLKGVIRMRYVWLENNLLFVTTIAYLLSTATSGSRSWNGFFFESHTSIWFVSRLITMTMKWWLQAQSPN
jgi:hypothetical protein